ncbi:MAG: serpin family protein [Oscillospiraceae bacterium]|nr:serpin family protein [Oscillospiraceae bacterium]
MTLFAGDNSGIQSKFLTVNAAVPKFDIASKHELSDTLKSLGITNAFSPETADFSALSDGDTVLSSIQHAARMTIDEEGATAAAFTVAMEKGAAMPPEEETDFILNRPFVVAITTRDGLPLFLGIVNTPS